MKTKSLRAARAQMARRQHGYSKERVAVLMRARGVNDWKAATTTNVENDRKEKWSLSEMVNLADVLAVPLEEMFPELFEDPPIDTGRYLTLAPCAEAA